MGFVGPQLVVGAGATYGVLDVASLHAQMRMNAACMLSNHLMDGGEHASLTEPDNSCMDHNPACMPTQTAVAEQVMQYMCEGVVALSAESSTIVNPTLFKSQNEYTLHYGSIPYKVFPLFEASYDRGAPLLNGSLHHLGGWIKELQQRTGSIRWTFAVGDCLHLCAKLVPREFDVVSTSSVADHIGLLALLQAARMVTHLGGFLLTETLLHLTYASDTEEYLKMNLMVALEMWPGVFGWRCFGYKGRLAPRSSEVQL